MQRVCAIVAVMVVIASPAFAQSAGKAQKQRSLQPSSYGAYGGHKRLHPIPTRTFSSR